jgi:hypothetical protein
VLTADDRGDAFGGLCVGPRDPGGWGAVRWVILNCDGDGDGRVEIGVPRGRFGSCESLSSVVWVECCRPGWLKTLDPLLLLEVSLELSGS